MSAPDLDRLEELLAARATDGLEPEEWTELETLLDAFPDEDPEQWDLAAAWLHTAYLEAEASPAEPLPAGLGQRIVAQGRLAVRTRGGSTATHEHSSRLADPPPTPRTTAPSSAAPPVTGLGWLGYAAAAAAGVVLTLLFLAEPAPVPLERAFARFAGEHPDAVEGEFGGLSGTGLDGVTGTVIWSDEAQMGYMKLVGMPVNDATQEQFQLWIVDEEQKHPVDGGVFDVAVEGGEVIIPIDAKLPVDDPTTFVITTEKPGGVPVSAGPFQVVATVERG